MGVKLANNAFSTLAAGITNSSTSMTIAPGTGVRFPVLSAGDYFYISIFNTANQIEIVKCTARVGDVLTIQRAQEGTTARAYNISDRIEMRVTAQTLLDVVAEAVAAALP
jgi:hypothetical protein